MSDIIERATIDIEDNAEYIHGYPVELVEELIAEVEKWEAHKSACEAFGTSALLDDKRNEIDSLTKEVERLEYAVEAMQDTANKDKVRHREQIESLTKELEGVKGKLLIVRKVQPVYINRIRS